MSFQYASDIHLEHETHLKNYKNIVEPRIGCDILILAGDIGYPNSNIFKIFMKWCVQNWKHVIMIAGNHEYYKNSVHKVNQTLNILAREIGFIFLNNSSIIIDNMIILGTTLWSEIPDDCWNEVRNYLNDFSYIEEFKNNYKTYDTLHQQAKNWLGKELSKETDKVKIVVTHHAPVEEITSAPIYRGKKTNKAFATDCSELLDMSDIWIYGHTHFNNYPIYRNCTVITNQRGYKGNCRNYRKQACIAL